MRVVPYTDQELAVVQYVIKGLSFMDVLRIQEYSNQMNGSGVSVEDVILRVWRQLGECPTSYLMASVKNEAVTLSAPDIRLSRYTRPPLGLQTPGDNNWLPPRDSRTFAGGKYGLQVDE